MDLVADLGVRDRTARPLADTYTRLCRLAARRLDVPAVLVTLPEEVPRLFDSRQPV